MSAYTHTLLATLGGQPQVVTFTLDLLLRRGLPISEVIVLHPEASDPRLQHSLACLNAEFVGDQYQFNGSTIHLRSQVLRLDDDTLLEDIVDDISATGALDTIHQLIRDLKQQYRCILIGDRWKAPDGAHCYISRSAQFQTSHGPHLAYLYSRRD